MYGCSEVVQQLLHLLFKTTEDKTLMLVKPSFKKRLLLTTLLSLSATQIFASNNSEQIPIGKLPEWVVPESYDLDFKIDPAQKAIPVKLLFI